MHMISLYLTVQRSRLRAKVDQLPLTKLTPPAHAFFSFGAHSLARSKTSSKKSHKKRRKRIVKDRCPQHQTATMKARSETRERSRRHGNWWLKAVLLGQLLLLFLHTANVVTVSAQDCSAFATPAVIKGKKIFNSLTGTYIPIKGVNYYPRPNAGELVQTNSIDFFTESYRAVWERDIIYFTQLHVNVVRIYAISPGQNHDGFMCALQAAGMYLMVGLAADCLDCAISSADAPNCYSAELKARGQFIIAEFARYDNVLAFSAGNEASLVAGSSVTNGPCQKQFIRDMRAFIQSCNSTIRHIPVGLEIADFEREAQALWYGYVRMRCR